MDATREISSTDLTRTLSRRRWLDHGLWLPALLALLLYLPALRAGLVWDDPVLLTHPLYRAPVHWG